jgi:hypothetical protein
MPATVVDTELSRTENGTMHNQVAQSKEYGIICAVFGGQTKFVVAHAMAVVHNGTVDYVR